MSTTYNENSIDTLEGAERVRRRPAAMLGSNNIKGAQHGVIEMYGNAADEASAGFGTKLDIKRHADGSISLRDYGRGVPLGWNEAKSSYNWHLVYNELYGGGKYDNNQEKLKQVTDWSTFDKRDYNYLYSVGLNGLGAASTQYTSEFFDVKSIRADRPDGGNTEYKMHFEGGYPIIDGRPINIQAEKYDLSTYNQVTNDTDEVTGTYIHWKPDAKVFTDVNITGDWLFDLCRDIAYVAHLDLDFEDEGTGRKEFIKAGDLTDLMKAKFGSIISHDEDGNEIYMQASGFDHGVTKVESEDFIWVAECDMVISPVNSNDCEPVCYHNTVKMNGGVQYEAINDCIYEFMRTKARSKGVKLDKRDLDGVFAVVLSSYSNYASFRNQTKDAIDDIFIYQFIKKILTDKLNIEYSKGNPIVTDAVEKTISNAQMRVQLKEAEKHIKSIEKMQKRQKDPEKFITCKEYRDKNYSRTELWITEGDSAKDSVMNARDAAFQAVYPIRGKGLNVFKATIDKILKNKEIIDIITLIGTGIDINIKGQKLFNIDDLRFDKIIFATDADVDGYQIRVLLFVLFYKLAPKLLTEGHIFIAETPRYAIKMRNGEVEYALDEKERDKIVSQFGGQISSISRFKGLGEVNADILKDTTVGVKGRHLIPLTVDLNNSLEKDLIDALFGEDKHNQRKEILTTVLGEEVAKEMEENSMLLNAIDDEDIEEDVEYEQWT